MYKKAFLSQNWNALRGRVPSQHDKGKKLSNQKVADAKKYWHYLKAARKRFRQRPRSVKHQSRAVVSVADLIPPQFVICPICTHWCIPELFRYHVARLHQSSLNASWMADY